MLNNPGLFARISLTVMVRTYFNTKLYGKHRASILGLAMLDCGYAWQHKLQMVMVSHFPISPNSFTL